MNINILFLMCSFGLQPRDVARARGARALVKDTPRAHESSPDQRQGSGGEVRGGKLGKELRSSANGHRPEADSHHGRFRWVTKPFLKRRSRPAARAERLAGLKRPFVGHLSEGRWLVPSTSVTAPCGSLFTFYPLCLCHTDIVETLRLDIDSLPARLRSKSVEGPRMNRCCC